MLVFADCQIDFLAKTYFQTVIGMRRGLVEHWVCKCGKKVPTAQAKCPYCGKDRPVTTTCRKCSFEFPLAAGKCPRCGKFTGRATFNLSLIAFTIIFVIVFGVFLHLQNKPDTSPFVPKQGYVGCSDKYGMVTTYAVYIGRAVACDQKINLPMEAVGAWMDECFIPSERPAQLQLFTAGTTLNAENQRSGKSPDGCREVARVFREVTWPDNNIVKREPPPSQRQTDSGAPTSTERVPLPVQSDTIPYIDKESKK